VRLVIADTGPINYLVLIGNIDLLPVLFERVILPSAVASELSDPDAPPLVREWIADPPAWLDIHGAPIRQFDEAALEGLDEGETAAIALAISLDADLVFLDDRKGVVVARRKGLRVTGTLGVLDLAAQRGLVSFAQAVDRLRRTSFRIPEVLLDSPMDSTRRNVRLDRSVAMAISRTLPGIARQKTRSNAAPPGAATSAR
jgi:predicted nucleic acid-binding protein